MWKRLHIKNCAVLYTCTRRPSTTNTHKETHFLCDFLIACARNEQHHACYGWLWMIVFAVVSCAAHRPCFSRLPAHAESVFLLCSLSLSLSFFISMLMSFIFFFFFVFSFFLPPPPLFFFFFFFFFFFPFFFRFFFGLQNPPSLRISFEIIWAQQRPRSHAHLATKQAAEHRRVHASHFRKRSKNTHTHTHTRAVSLPVSRRRQRARTEGNQPVEQPVVLPASLPQRG